MASICDERSVVSRLPDDGKGRFHVLLVECRYNGTLFSGRDVDKPRCASTHRNLCDLVEITENFPYCGHPISLRLDKNFAGTAGAWLGRIELG